MTSQLHRIDYAGWSPHASSSSDLATTLEAGNVLFMPSLRFGVEPREATLFTPSILGTAKNASFDPASARLHGVTISLEQAELLGSMMRRFSDAALDLVCRICPRYRMRIERRRASFRPAEIAGRVTTWRKDDTRLHVDSFPASPSGGCRILRVFTNVNPDGRVRSWRIGGEFDDVARRFAGQLRLPLPGSAELLRLFRITRSTRTPYDALMLQLHDRMKADADFQTHAPQMRVDFPAGSTWIAFTDQVSHAATAGQYQLEQTFLLPVDAMADPERSPLRVLERIMGRRLAN